MFVQPVQANLLWKVSLVHGCSVDTVLFRAYLGQLCHCTQPSLCVLCSQVSNSCISFPVYLKCSRWFPGKICVFRFSDLYLGIFPPDFCYQSCFIFCLWGIPWLNVCDIRGLKRTEPFYSLHVFSFCRRGNPPDCTTAVLPMKWWFETENSILEICISSAEKILLFLLQIVF